MLFPLPQGLLSLHDFNSILAETSPPRPHIPRSMGTSVRPRLPRIDRPDAVVPLQPKSYRRPYWLPPTFFESEEEGNEMEPGGRSGCRKARPTIRASTLCARPLVLLSPRDLCTTPIRYKGKIYSPPVSVYDVNRATSGPYKDFHLPSSTNPPWQMVEPGEHRSAFETLVERQRGEREAQGHHKTRKTEQPCQRAGKEGK